MLDHRSLALAVLSVLGLGLAAPGCSAELALEERLFSCVSDSECASGYVCRVSAGGICVRADAIDDDAPDLTDADADPADTQPRDTQSDATDTSDTLGVDGTDTAALDTSPDVADTSPDVADTSPDVADTGLDSTDTLDTDVAPDIAPDLDVVEPQTFLITDDVATDTTWEAPHTYVLTRPIFVTSGARLTIEAGVTVLGEPLEASEDAGALVITRGSRLYALGTGSNPIVFTSANAVGARAAGDWGGLVLLGSASNNDADGEITYERFGDITASANRRHGGSDDQSSCGELRYVRVEFAGGGTLAEPNNLGDGVYIGSCGAGTIIDYLQVLHTGEDAIDVEGGTAPLRHLAIHGFADDGFSWDFGYRGSLQFVVVTSELGEGSLYGNNRSSDHRATPLSDPLVYNVTSVGGNDDAIDIRTGSGGDFHNILGVGHGDGIDFRHEASVQRAVEGDLTLTHSLFFDLGDLAADKNDLDDCRIWVASVDCDDACASESACLTTCRDAIVNDPSLSWVFANMTQAEITMYFDTLTQPDPFCTEAVAFDPQAWISTASSNNILGINPELFDVFSPYGLYPRSATSPAATGTTPPAMDAWGVSFDTGASWIGAFEPGGSVTWLDGWTAFPAN